jgi:KaiC/GvpD/RAD55 family RecA-like ATPase
VSAPGRRAPQPEPRISTGNAGLDAMLEGGVIPRRPYLIVGPSGTGKTTLALQFLCEGVRRGERALLVTLEEPPNEVRVNHRGLGSEFDRVEVFDAIPDVMRYERVPFKDISAVRQAMSFGQVPLVIRRTPELTGVEVTITALEQMLRSEVARRGYTRLVIDSLTALQYFCMKGFNEVAGAQTFLRFLSDLHVTTFLTVESPLEDVDTTERMLARGEIRLFRWELEGATVRAIGVEKFRGGAHDVRLHPYRIGPSGIDIHLDATISRDTRRVVEPAAVVGLAPEIPEAESPLDPLTNELEDLVVLGADVGPVRADIEAALGALGSNDLEAVERRLVEAVTHSLEIAGSYRDPTSGRALPATPAAREALRRIVVRSDAIRAGMPPSVLPAAAELEAQLHRLLAALPAPVVVAPGPAVPPVRPEPALVAPSAPVTAAAAPAAPSPPPMERPPPVPAAPGPIPTPVAPPGPAETIEPPVVPVLPASELEPAPAPEPEPAESPASEEIEVVEPAPAPEAVEGGAVATPVDAGAESDLASPVEVVGVVEAISAAAPSQPPRTLEVPAAAAPALAIAAPVSSEPASVPAAGAPVVEVPSGPPPPFPTLPTRAVRAAPSASPPAVPAAVRHRAPPEPPVLPARLPSVPRAATGGPTGGRASVGVGPSRPVPSAAGPAPAAPPPLPRTAAAVRPAPPSPRGTAPVARSPSPAPAPPAAPVTAPPTAPASAETARPVAKRKRKAAPRAGRAETDEGAAEEAGAPPAPRTRKRAVRKRKAPPVISATAGAIPPGVFGTDAPSTAEPHDPPPPEQP